VELQDYTTIYAIEFLKTKFPKQLDIMDFVGSGNLPLLQSMVHKPVAVIDENSFEMGIKAAELLFKMIHEKTNENIKQQNIQIPCKLIVF
jgi:DNA-binding LacI/PurR family transcriptional regulator